MPKTPAIIEQLGGNPLAVTLRRKAEMEMELRALKIEQLTAKRRKASLTVDTAAVAAKNTIIRINPNKFPNGLPNSLNPNQQQTPTPPQPPTALVVPPTAHTASPTPPPVVVQSVPQVTPPPGTLR